MRQVTKVSTHRQSTLPIMFQDVFVIRTTVLRHLPKLCHVGPRCVSFRLRTPKDRPSIWMEKNGKTTGRQNFNLALLGSQSELWMLSCIIPKDTFRRSPLLGATPTRAASLARLRRSQPLFMAWYMAPRVGAMVSRTGETDRNGELGSTPKNHEK